MFRKKLLKFEICLKIRKFLRKILTKFRENLMKKFLSNYVKVLSSLSILYC